jgi:hypothetical protein
LYEDEEGYTLNVYTASGKEEHTLYVHTAKMDTPYTSTLQEIERDALCTRKIQAVEKGCNLCTSTLHATETDNPHAHTTGGGKENAPTLKLLT